MGNKKNKKLTKKMSVIIISSIATVLALIGVFFYRNIKKNNKASYNNARHQKKDLTLEQLADYDGSKYGVIFIACNGDIFDVTESPFYKKPSSYAIFAGKDATVALARYDLTGRWCNKTKNTTLTEDEQQIVNEWHDKFVEKYSVVGKLL